MKGGAVFGVALAMVAVACGSDGGSPSTMDNGTKGGCACIGPGPESGAPMPVDWNAPTAIGKSPAEVFGGVNGTCTAPLTWDATSEDELVVTPAKESSKITVAVTVDETTARIVTHTSAPLMAPPTLMVDASVHVASDDGTLVADGTSTISFFSPNDLASLQFTVPVDKLGGTLSITPKDPKTSVSLAFEVGSIANGCTGDIRIETAMAVGTNGAFGSSGGFGSWSDTGCPVAQMSVDVDKAKITDAWGDRTYDGTWDDGTTTQFHVAIDTLPDTACSDPRYLGGDTLFTSSITYDSADGRLQRHSASANVHIREGATMLSLDTTEDYTCATSSTLPYTPDDCKSFSRDTLQLFLGPDGGNLTVYEFDKNTDPNTSSSDSMHEIRFNNPH